MYFECYVKGTDGGSDAIRLDARCDITRNARMAADDALHADAETIEITFAQKKEPYSQRFFRASDARSSPAVSKAV